MEALKFYQMWVLCPSMNGMDQWSGIDEHSSRGHFSEPLLLQKTIQVSKCQLIAPNLIFLFLLWKHNQRGIFFPMDSAADKTVAQILKTAFMKSFYFVTSALISVWLMVLLFMTHIDILSVKSRYSHCPEVLRKKHYGTGKRWW